MQQRKQKQRNAIARSLPAKLGHSSSAPVVVCVTSAGLKSHKSGMLFEA
jgi:hypothetical protein